MTGSRAHVSVDDLAALRRRARGFSFLPRQPVHSLLTGRHGSRLRGRGLNFEELRHYSEGDDTRTIDWRATARLGEPYVRVNTEERDRSVLLVVDQRLSMFFGSRRATKSVVAAEAAAMAAWRVTSLGDRVGAVVFSDECAVRIKPMARAVGAMRVITEVARQNGALSADAATSGRPQAFNEALQSAARLATHDGLICLITDAAGSDLETVELITRITAHNDVLIIFVYDRLEAQLPDIGRAVVVGGDAHMEVDMSSRGLRRDYAHDFESRRARLETFSRRRAIPVLPIVTDRDVAEQVREALGRREQSSRRGHNALVARGGG